MTHVPHVPHACVMYLSAGGRGSKALESASFDPTTQHAARLQYSPACLFAYLVASARANLLRVCVPWPCGESPTYAGAQASTATLCRWTTWPSSCPCPSAPSCAWLGRWAARDLAACRQRVLLFGSVVECASAMTHGYLPTHGLAPHAPRTYSWLAGQHPRMLTDSGRHAPLKGCRYMHVLAAGTRQAGRQAGRHNQPARCGPAAVGVQPSALSHPASGILIAAVTRQRSAPTRLHACTCPQVVYTEGPIVRVHVHASKLQPGAPEQSILTNTFSFSFLARGGPVRRALPETMVRPPAHSPCRPSSLLSASAEPLPCLARLARWQVPF